MRGLAIAMWSGIFAFLSNLMVISIIDVYNLDQLIEYLSASVVALLTAGSIYAKLKLDEIKENKDKKDVV